MGSFNKYNCFFIYTNTKIYTVSPEIKIVFQNSAMVVWKMRAPHTTMDLIQEVIRKYFDLDCTLSSAIIHQGQLC
jgi:hypothetical protein